MTYNLKELVDIEKLQKITDELSSASSVLSAVLTLDGEILTSSGWQRICKDFHRAHPQIAKECNKSDTKLRKEMNQGEWFAMYKCPRGLVDISAPIIIEGEHIANVFSGQVFLEPPDNSTEQFFREQAKKFGFDEKDYMSAFKEIPVISEDKLKSTISFLARLVQMIAENGLQQLKELEVYKKLDESEEKYRMMIQLIPDMLMLMDSKGVAVYISPQAETVLGYPSETFIGIDFPDIIHKDDVERVLKHQQQVILGEKLTDLEYRIIDKEGSIRWVSHTATPVIENNQVVRIFNIVKNVTDKKLAEQTLRESESKYRLLAENASDVIWTMDLEQKYTYVSASVEKMRGYTPEEAINASVEETLTPASYEKVIQVIMQELEKENDPDAEKNRTVTMELEQTCKDGTTVWTEVSTSFIRNEDGLAIGVMGIARDISERKKTENALRESEKRFKALHNASFGGITIHDKGVILECNHGLSVITGYSADELIGMDGLLLISEKSRDLVMSNILSGYEKPYEAIGLRKNGEEYPLRLEARNVPYKGKNVRTVEFRDITDAKEAEKEKFKLEAQLQQSQKMESIGRLAGGVAHDFNNLLTGIIGNVMLAKMDISPDDPLSETFDEINQAAQSAANLTHQLLAFSRKQIIKPKVLDLNELIKNLNKMLQRLIGEHIELRTFSKGSLSLIKSDPSQVEQIIINLAVNARDAMPNGGKLTIETADASLDAEYCKKHPHVEAGNYVLLAISDNGVGIDKETQQHIFDPFYTTKEEGRGTGLGLSTVYGIIKQHNGHIEVYSELGHGTTFRVYLPVVYDKADKLTNTKTRADIPEGTETVLVVEDEDLVRNIAIKILKRQGYKVYSADSGGNAQALVEDKNLALDLLVTDIVMPNMNGRELAERMVTRSPDLKVLYTSGYTEDVIGHHGILDEGLHFIGKPYTPFELAKKVRKVLDTSQ